VEKPGEGDGFLSTFIQRGVKWHKAGSNFFQINPKRNWRKAEISEKKLGRVLVVQPNLQSQWST